MHPESLAVILSRIQFGFTVSFHLIFPVFTIGLAAWLAVLEALHLKTGRGIYRSLFDFWLRVFAVAFGLHGGTAEADARSRIGRPERNAAVERGSAAPPRPRGVEGRSS